MKMKPFVPWIIVAVLLGGGALWLSHRRSEAMRIHRLPGHRDRRDINTITSALRFYEMDAGTPPTTEQGLAALVHAPTEPPLPKRWKAMMKKPLKDRWGREYQYRYPGLHNPDSYDVWSLGQDGVPSEDDFGNWRREYDNGNWIWDWKTTPRPPASPRGWGSQPNTAS